MKDKGIYDLCERLGVGLIDLEKLPAGDWVRVKPEKSHWRNGFDIARPVRESARYGSPALCNAGVVVRGPGGGLGSTQSFCAGNGVLDSGAEISIEAWVSPMPRRLPTPAAFLLLRALSLTAFRSRRLREMAKRWLVRLLITPRRAWPVRNLRRIRLGPEITISDDLQCPRVYQPTAASGPFLAIHMASQGYWQIQDEDGA